MKDKDTIGSPSYYTNGRFEVIDIIEDQLGEEGLRGFCIGNALKYICRAGKKPSNQKNDDLEKACWYLNHYIEREEILSAQKLKGFLSNTNKETDYGKYN